MSMQLQTHLTSKAKKTKITKKKEKQQHHSGNKFVVSQQYLVVDVDVVYLPVANRTFSPQRRARTMYATRSPLPEIRSSKLRKRTQRRPRNRYHLGLGQTTESAAAKRN